MFIRSLRSSLMTFKSTFYAHTHKDICHTFLLLNLCHPNVKNLTSCLSKTECNFIFIQLPDLRVCVCVSVWENLIINHKHVSWEFHIYFADVKKILLDYGIFLKN